MKTFTALLDGGMLNLVRVYIENMVTSIKEKQRIAEIAEMQMMTQSAISTFLKKEVPSRLPEIEEEMRLMEQMGAYLYRGSSNYDSQAQSLRESLNFITGFKSLLLLRATEDAAMTFEQCKLEIEVKAVSRRWTDEEVEGETLKAKHELDLALANAKLAIAATFDPSIADLEALIQTCVQLEVRKSKIFQT